MEQKEQKPKLNVTKEELIPYIILYGQSIHKQINDAKKKYGSMFNNKNKISEAFRKFGDPVTSAQKYADEYDKITERRSDLPASVRYIVRDVCERALGQCIYDKMRETMKEEKPKKSKKNGKTKEH